jgi:hypothetical protein
MGAVAQAFALPLLSMAEASATLDQHTGAVVLGALYAAVVGHLFMLPLARHTLALDAGPETPDEVLPGPLGVVERLLYVGALLADAGIFIPLWIVAKVVGGAILHPGERGGLQRSMLLNGLSVLFAASGWAIATQGRDGDGWVLALAIAGPPLVALALTLWIDVRGWNAARGTVSYGDTRDYVSSWLESPLGTRRRAWLHRPAEWLGWARRREPGEPPPDAPGATDTP